MSVSTTENFVLDKFTAVDFLTGEKGRTILLNDVSWKEYEMFLEDFETRAGWRLTYDRGKLEIMPPLMEHEAPSRSIDRFVWAYCEHFEMTVESVGSTTYRRKLKKKGVEPDACFYIQNADQVIGKSKLLEPESYPVSDIAIEIDITHSSLDKLSIYAALEVPELWLYDGKKMIFYELAGKKYHPIAESRALPKISAAELTEFLRLSLEKGQTAALKSFRARLHNLK